MKGFAEIVGFVIVTLLIVAAVVVVLTIGIPIIQEATERGVINEAQINMRIVDEAVKRVASQGTGTLTSTRMKVTDGLYRVNPESESFDFQLGVKSDAISRGTFTRQGNLYTFFVGAASARENTTHIILENEVLEVVQPKVGSEASFASINTTDAISTMKLKENGATIVPADSRIIFDNVAGTSWGTGYSKVAFQGSNLGEAESIFHVRSSASNLEYEVVYTLPASSDFLIISVRNVSRTNKTTMVMSYKLGDTINNDLVRVGNVNQSTFSATQINKNFTLNLENPSYAKNTSFTLLGMDAFDVYYNASDGTNRSITELEAIGQGEWGWTSDGFTTNITHTLAGSDGWDYGVRDAYPGGSYWLDENGRSLDSGLIGYWKLAEGKGSIAYDSSGNNVRGTLTTSPAWISNSSCVLLTCLRFNGSNYVNFGDVNAFDGLSQITVSAWFNSTPSSSYRSIVTKGYNTGNVFELKMVRDSEGPRVFFRITTTAGTASASLPQAQWSITNNEWHHVVGTYDGSYVRLYFDGVLIASTLHNGTMASNTKALMIGSTDDGAAERFVGLIDEVRIYDRALSENEIKRLRQLSSIKIQNDFLAASAQPYTFMNLTNYTGGSIFTQATESIIVDNNPITSNYSANNTRVYFFDWKDMSWKTWMKGADNATHGVPDWLDPRFKEQFRWKYAFERVGYPSINFTYLMTAHDPFVRTFVDTGPTGYTSVVDANTTAIWQFNEGNGTSTRDETNKGNTGAITGATWNASGKISYGLSFDGVDDEVDAGSGSSIDNIFTGGGAVAAWINPNSDGEGDFGRIVVKGDTAWAFWVEDESGGNVRLGFAHSTSGAAGDWKTSTRAVPTNTLTHVALVYDSSSASNDPIFYVNGRSVTTTEDATPTGTAVDDSSENLVIGNRPTGDLTFNGVIDEVRLWSRTLTPEEISDEHQRGADHNITIPADMGEAKTRYYVKTIANSGTPNGYYTASAVSEHVISIFNYTGRYRVSDSGQSVLSWGTFNTTAPIVIFTDRIQNDGALFTTSNYRIGIKSRPGVAFYINDSTPATADKYDKFWYEYDFNSTNNNNFLFTLGHVGRIDTRGWGGDPSAGSSGGPDNTTWAFGNETIETIANSTLTYYDLRDSSLIAWWKFDDGGTTKLSDSSGNNNTANVTGAVFVDGKFGDGLRFDGNSDDEVETDNPFDFNLNQSTYTFSAWVNPNYYATNPGFGSWVVVWRGADIGMSIVEVSSSNFGIKSWAVGRADSVVGSASYGSWHHIAVVYPRLGSPYREVYIDGELAGTDMSGDVPVISGTLTIGDRSGYTQTNNGTIDNVKVYSRALTAEEIRSDYLSTADDYPNLAKMNQTDGATSIPAVSFNYDGGASGIWHFDEGSGLNVTDSSGSGNTGSLGNSTTVSQPVWVVNSSCKSGACLRFDGTGDAVEVPYSPELQPETALTLEAWIYPQSTPSLCCTGIISADSPSSGPYHMYYSTGQKIITDIGGISVTSATSVSLNQWSHVAVTYDERTGRADVYVNGRFDGMRGGGGAMTTNSNKLKIGRDVYHDQTFTGMIDEVRIYPRALTDREIKEHYSGVTRYYDDFGTAANGRTYRYVGVEDSGTNLQPVTPNGTVLHLRFNDNSTLNATDRSGLGNIGRNVNAFWITNSSCKGGFGGCIGLNNDTTRYVSVPDSASLSITNKVTYSVWARKFSGSGQLQAIISKSDNADCGSSGPSIHVLTNDVPQFDVDVDGSCLGVSGATQLSDDEWHMITGTYDGSVAKIYVDGVLEGTSSVDSGSMADRTHDVLVGATKVGGSVVRTFRGQIDEVIIVDKSLGADEIYQLYLGGINRTSNGRVHRIASADDLNSMAFNLTEHNNTFTTQDYDMRVIFANSTSTSVISTPIEACYTRTQLSDYYLCSYDETEFSTPKVSGMIYAGENHLLDSICNDAQGGLYKFNMTTVGPSRAVVPFTNGVCDDLGNKTDIIEREKIPSTVFGDVTLSGEKTIFMSLLYRDIKLRGDARLGPGDQRICIEKTGSQGERVFVNITSC